MRTTMFSAHIPIRMEQTRKGMKYMLTLWYRSCKDHKYMCKSGGRNCTKSFDTGPRIACDTTQNRYLYLFPVVDEVQHQHDAALNNGHLPHHVSQQAELSFGWHQRWQTQAATAAGGSTYRDRCSVVLFRIGQFRTHIAEAQLSKHHCTNGKADMHYGVAY